MKLDQHWIWDNPDLLQEVKFESGHRPEVLSAIGAIKMYLALENRAMEECEPSSIQQYKIYVEAAADTLYGWGFL